MATSDANVLAVSVVIQTCGRPELLKRCLHALLRQTLDGSRFQIIVADDSGARHGPAAARNRGWLQARAPIVAFTDDDTVPAPDWLEKGLAAFDDEIDGISGRIVGPVPQDPAERELDPRGLERGGFLTANCFVRASLLEEIGGFDEDFHLGWREDCDLLFRLLQAGARIVHAPGVLVARPALPARWGVSLRRQRKVMFDALLYKKHRRLYRERIRATPRRDYYAIVGALGLGSGALGSGLPDLGMVLLIAWAGLTAAFCSQRMKGTLRGPLHALEVVLTSMAIPPVAVFWRIVGALRFRVAFI